MPAQQKTIHTSHLVFLILLITVSCGDLQFEKKRIENSGSFSAGGRMESCGTILSVGDVKDKGDQSDITLIAQASVCGWLEGNEEPWMALGLTMSTGEILVKDSPEADAKKGSIFVIDDKVFAVVDGKKSYFADLTGDLEMDTGMKLRDGVRATFLIDGKPYEPSGLEDKERQSKDQHVVITLGI